MSISLMRLYNNAEKPYEMRLIAGSSGMENYVHWVHMVEDREVSDFLHGNELIFTTGIAQKSTAWLLDFVKNLHKQGACGLVINLGPYIAAVPPEVIIYCEQQGFPLFTVPWKVRLVDITYDFCHRIVTSEETEVSLAAAFRNAIFFPEDEKNYKPALERRGFNSEAQFCVAALDLISETPPNDKELRMLKFQAQRILGKLGDKFCLFFQERKMVAILQGYGDEQVISFLDSLAAVCKFQQCSYTLHAGIGPSGRGFASVSNSYRKAMSAMRIAVRHLKNYWFYKDMGVYKLLISIEDPNVLRQMYKETLGVLEEFDRKNATDYVDTLRCYLEHNSSVQEVAKITFVHRNTINYKIKRIREILGCELNPEDRLKFMLAFYIKDLI